MGRVDLITQCLTAKAVSAVLVRFVEHISNSFEASCDYITLR